MWNSGCWNDWKSSSANSSSVTTSQPEIHIWPSNMVKWSVKKSPGPTLTFWMCLRQHTESYMANPLLNHGQNEHLHRTCWTMLNHNVNQNRLARIVPLASASKQLAEVYLRSEGHGITIHGAPDLYWWMYGMFTFSSNYMKRTGIRHLGEAWRPTVATLALSTFNMGCFFLVPDHTTGWPSSYNNHRISWFIVCSRC